MPKLEVGLVVEGALQGHEVCDDVEYVFEVTTSAPVDVGKAIDDAMEAAKLAWPNADEYFLEYVKEYHSVH
tara:strand:- start:1491 stop:1703 length:213 start_codon:yes stop_codon:yes gene_type:complete